MINHVTLVGNLTRDPETSNGPNTTMTRMRVATNSVWRNSEGVRQEAAEFHSVVAFGRLAETCATYCTRGKRLYVEGRLRTRDYQAADGTTRYSTEIVAETVRFLDRAPQSAATGDAVAEPESADTELEVAAAAAT